MITADKVRELISMGPRDLTLLIRRAGYKEDSFTTAEFLGMTNAGMFCYRCEYPGEFEDSCKVFVRIDTDGTIRAEY